MALMYLLNSERKADFHKLARTLIEHGRVKNGKILIQNEK